MTGESRNMTFFFSLFLPPLACMCGLMQVFGCGCVHASFQNIFSLARLSADVNGRGAQAVGRCACRGKMQLLLVQKHTTCI